MRAAIVLLLCSACASTTVRAPRTDPRLEASSREPPPAVTRVALVVSHDAFTSIARELRFEPDRSAIRGGPPQRDDAAAADALSWALFEAGWEPLSRAQLASVITSHRTAVALRALAPDRATLLQAAGVVGPASRADRVLVVRGWRSAWAPAAAAGAWTLCAASVELDVGAYDRTGALLWEGSAGSRSSDAGELSMTIEGGRPVLADPTRACAARGCGECAPLPEELVRELARDAAARLVGALDAAATGR
jgi:hypothetical protein